MTASLPAPPLAPSALKCTCADWWAHPAVPLLVGDAMRPGGARLTASLVDQVGLPRGARVLDVGTGNGVTLALLAARGLRGVGLDYSTTLAIHALDHAPVSAGDAEALPFPAAAFEAATIECVLSALPDKPAALAEVHRILAARGHLILTDMTIDGPLPEPLDTVLAWVACAAGALPPSSYVDLLTDTGFVVTTRADHRAALGDFLAKARRRLALLQGAVRAGIVPDPEATIGPELAALRDATDHRGDLAALGHHVLGQVADAVHAGQLGYCAITAQRVS